MYNISSLSPHLSHIPHPSPMALPSSFFFFFFFFNLQRSSSTHGCLRSGPYAVANGSSELGIKVVKWIPGDMNEKDTTIHTRFSLFAAHNDFSELLRGEYPSSAGGLEMLVELLRGE
mmetsp:Transcript_46460/g.107213  ORF Transcript_46460/g.107213 Transcript_46460/m.107213 type:complete len:117 (-) Transcript_46460:75-425(-)